MRLEDLKTIHPKVYQALKELRDTVQSNMRLIDNQKASDFYADVSSN
jgi:hypothetical protein